MLFRWRIAVPTGDLASTDGKEVYPKRIGAPCACAGYVEALLVAGPDAVWQAAPIRTT